MIVSVSVAGSLLALRFPEIRASLHPKRVAIIFLLAAFLSGMSSFISRDNPSGTGWHSAFGYPRPFYFIWEGFAGGQRHSGLSLLRFLENSLIYGVTIVLIMLIYSLISLGIRQLNE